MTALIALLSFLPFLCDVSKEDVKQLVAAGVSENTIIAYIRAHEPVAVLSPDDLEELRHARVSENIIEAMIAGSTGTGELPEYAPLPSETYPWYYPYGYYYDFFYRPGFWWYFEPYRRRYPNWTHYYHFPNYPYGPHWRPRASVTGPLTVTLTVPSRPPVTHSRPRGRH